MDEPKDSLRIKTLNQLMLLGTARGLVHPSVSDMHNYNLGWAKNGTHAPGHKKWAKACMRPGLG